MPTTMTHVDLAPSSPALHLLVIVEDAFEALLYNVGVFYLPHSGSSASLDLCCIVVWPL